MNLNEAKLNTECIVKDVVIEDFKTKLRVMELGINVGTKIAVKNKSIFKKTLLVAFNASCFTLKSSIAEKVLLEYA